MATQSQCPHCDGSGWKVVERGGVSAAERCECAFGVRARRLEDGAGIPPLYQNASFDNFSVRSGNPLADRELAHVLLTVRGFAREFPGEKRPGLLLIGEPGTGKTHLAVAALRHLIARGFEALFFDYQNLLDRIRSGWDPNSGSSDREAFRSALEAEVLLLDDLGSQRAAEWVEDTMTGIVTYRCNNQKPLIATTNLPDTGAGDNLVERSPELAGSVRYRLSLGERIGERARSRLFEMCKVVHMPAVGDYRLKQVK